MVAPAPESSPPALNRLIAFVPYAIVVDPVLAALGALLVFAVGAVTLAFQTLFFVILGNPSAAPLTSQRCSRRSGAP